jgi:hypothetical protein
VLLLYGSVSTFIVRQRWGSEVSTSGGIRMLVVNGSIAKASNGHQPAAILVDESTRWFTHVESLLIEALASVIVPADKDRPGAHDARIMSRLDALVASSPERHALYREGVAAFERLAILHYRRPFTSLSFRQQSRVFTAVDWAYEGKSVITRVRRKLLMLYFTGRGLGAAVMLFPQLVRDVQDLFYTSPIAWAWLRYDGPPLARRQADPVISQIDTWDSRTWRASREFVE